MKVLAFGEILWDVINGTEHLGGAPFNFAAHTAQCGNQSFIVSRLGSDFLGMRAFNKSKLYNVDVSLIEWDELYPTGIVDVSLANGQPDYTIRESVAYDFITGDAALMHLQKHQFEIFYFGSLAQRNHVSAHALSKLLSAGKFKHIFYDVNLRKSGFTEEIVKASLKACTIFKLNNDEVPVISEMMTGTTLTNESFCKCLRVLYPNIQIIIITASEKGCFIFQDQELIYVPGTPAQVSDAVGAGDAFSASFMHIYASGGDALVAAQVANQVGAFVATRSGAIPDYSPAMKDLLKKYSNKVMDKAPRTMGI
jgi:fructokinase